MEQDTPAVGQTATDVRTAAAGTMLPDFMPAEPPADGDALNALLTQCVSYVLGSIPGRGQMIAAVEFGALEASARWDVVILVEGTAVDGDYTGREDAVDWILRNLVATGKPEVVEAMSLAAAMWRIDGDDDKDGQWTELCYAWPKMQVLLSGLVQKNRLRTRRQVEEAKLELAFCRRRYDSSR